MTGEDILVKVEREAGNLRAAKLTAGASAGRIGQPSTIAAGGDEGVFATWNWTGQQLDVHVDRYGLFPIYYFDTGHSFAFSTSIPKLLDAGAPRELDDDAMAVFLRLGFYIGNDTPFRGIRALPPGAHLRWKSGSLELNSSLLAGPKLDISRQDAIATYATLFRAAVARRLPPENSTSAVTLSGGRDSRHILLELIEQGRPPSLCVTAKYYAYRTTSDPDIASKLSRAVGVAHQLVEQPPSALRTYLRHHFETNFCTTTPSHFVIAVADFVRTRSSVLYDGIGGDVLSAGLFQTEARMRLFREGKIEALADDLLKHFDGGSGYHERLIQEAFTPKTRARFRREVALERMVQELDRYSEMTNPIAAFCFFNRTRRDVAFMPFRMQRGVPTVHSPYLDYALFDFLWALPPELVIDHQFHTDTIAATYPRWADIPYAGDAPKPKDAWRGSRDFAVELNRFCAAGFRAPPFKPSFLVPRLTRMLLDRSYSRIAWWLGPLALYFKQLERLASGRLTSADAPQ